MYDLNLPKIKNIFNYNKQTLRQSTYFHNIDFLNIENSKFILLGLHNNFKTNHGVKVFINYIKDNQQITKQLSQDTYQIDFLNIEENIFEKNINSTFENIDKFVFNKEDYNCIIITFNQDILSYCENNKELFSIFIEYEISILDSNYHETFISLIQLNTTYPNLKLANQDLKHLLSDFDSILNKDEKILINLGVKDSFNYYIRRFNNLSFPQIDIKQY